MAANGNVAAALQYAILQQQQQLLQQAAFMTRSQANIPVARHVNNPCVGSNSIDGGHAKQQPTLEALLHLERFHRSEQFSATAGQLNQQTNNVLQPHVQYQQQLHQHEPFSRHAAAATRSALSAAQVQYWEQQQRAVLLALLRQQQQLNLQQLLSSYPCGQSAGLTEAATSHRSAESAAFWSSNAAAASPQTVSMAPANLTRAVKSSNSVRSPSVTVSSVPHVGSSPSEAHKAGPPTILIGEVPSTTACDTQLQQQQEQRQLRQSPKAVHEFGCWSDLSDSEAGSSVGGSSERGELDDVLSSCGGEAVDGLDGASTTEGGLGLPSEEDFQLHLLGVLTSYL